MSGREFAGNRNKGANTANRIAELYAMDFMGFPRLDEIFTEEQCIAMGRYGEWVFEKEHPKKQIYVKKKKVNSCNLHYHNKGYRMNYCITRDRAALRILPIKKQIKIGRYCNDGESCVFSDSCDFTRCAYNTKKKKSG